MRKRLLRRTSSLLVIVGGIVLAYPFWSAGYARVQQGRLSDTFSQAERSFERVVQSEIDSLSAVRDPQWRMRLTAKLFHEKLQAGDPIGRLRIPRLGLNAVVLEGEPRGRETGRDPDQALLRSGPVHYATTPIPGLGQPFAVAGHRTTYGAPFLRLDTMRPGDRLAVITPYGRFTYTVSKLSVVRPNQVSVLRDRGYDLVLTTCHPAYSAARRLILWARLTEFAFR